MAQGQVRRENREQEETPPPPPAAAKAPQAKKEAATDDEELDKLLDAVDERLEENAEEFLSGYKQRGGE